MPRYFLHLEKGEDLYLDNIGCSAVDEYEVLSAFVEILAEYRRERHHRSLLSEFNLSITDDSGRKVVQLSW